MTCCMVLANRSVKDVQLNYYNSIGDLIQLVLDRI